ncbi:MAG: tRNA pseudouridine(55) synthase TruB [Marvinbryantia sp.]|jgi:tRNA pseudouridine55 synthase
MINGILNVYKEKGFTSHDVVAKLRGILHQKKIGHTGTLDPDAEGVLPVCLGNGTKLCDTLTDRDKAYRTVLLLGRVTDTQDISGKILQTSEVTVTEAQVYEAVQQFVGAYDQVPPMYSALKVNGKKLYELAREGKTVERAARKVTIYEIKIEKMELPRVTMTVSCSKGTYIRTLCHDIGERLGCGGCMEQLLRIKAGPFVLSDSLTLAQIEQKKQEGYLQEIVIPVEQMFMENPICRTKPEFDKMLYNGNPVFGNQLTERVCVGRVRMQDSTGRFCGLYEYRKEKNGFWPVKMFLE